MTQPSFIIIWTNIHHRPFFRKWNSIGKNICTVKTFLWQWMIQLFSMQLKYLIDTFFVILLKVQDTHWNSQQPNSSPRNSITFRSVDYKDSFLIVLAVAAVFGLVYLLLFFAVRKEPIKDEEFWGRAVDDNTVWCGRPRTSPVAFVFLSAQLSLVQNNFLTHLW